MPTRDAGLAGRSRPWPLAVGLLVLAALGVAQESPRVGLLLHPADSSIEGTLPHLRTLTACPRNVGSDGHRSAREYLLGQIREIGLSPEVQQATVLAAESRTFGRIENVLVRIPGTAPSRALLVMAHYDSVAAGPGCGDDAAAVAVLLDVSRSLASVARPRNDVILLFTDGEELGLLGARAFVERHSWMRDVGLAINFDSGGVSGPAALWETSRGNARLVRHYAQAVPFVVAGSWSADRSYGTDLAPFRRAGIPGLGLGFLGGQATHYHRATDSLDRLDPVTLRHARQTLFHAIHHFGNVPLPLEPSDDAIYFALFGRVVAYPRAVGWALLAIVYGSVSAQVYRLRKRDRQVLALTTRAAGTFVVATAAAAALVLGLWQIVRAVHPRYYAGFPDGGWNAAWYWAAFAGLGAVAFLVALSRVRRRLGDAPALLSAAVAWAVLASGALLVLPGASALATWPALGLALATHASRGSASGLARAAALLGASAPALLLLLPFLRTLAIAAGLDGAFVVAVFVALLLGSLLPQVLELHPAGGRSPTVVVSLAVAACLAAGSATARFTGREPDCSAVEYAYDHEGGRATWRPSLSPAPPPARSPLAIRAGDDRFDPTTKVREVRFAVEAPPTGTIRMTVDGDEPATVVLSGLEVPLTDSHRVVTVHVPNREPLETSLRTSRTGPVTVRIELSMPLRDLDGIVPPARSRWALPGGDRATLTSAVRFAAARDV